MPWYEVVIKSSEVFEAEDQDEANEYAQRVTTLVAVECDDPNEVFVAEMPIVEPAFVKKARAAKAKKKAKVKAKSTYRRKKKARLR